MSYTTKHDDKAAVDRLFKALRRAGYIARQNFYCCNGCASGKIANDFGAMPENRRVKVQGAVYYAKQEAARMWDNNSVGLCFGQIESGAYTTDKSTMEVGQEVVKLALAQNLTVVWDGDTDKCIEIYFEGAFRCWYPKQESVAA